MFWNKVLVRKCKNRKKIVQDAVHGYNPFNKIAGGGKKSAISKTESSNKIQDSMKRCIKSQAGLTALDHLKCSYIFSILDNLNIISAQAKCEVDMVNNLQNSSLYKEDETFKNLIDLWAQAARQMDVQTNELNSISNKVVVEPMKKFSTIFPSLQMAMRKREQSLQEFTKCQEKVEKYLKRERTGPNAVKLENSRKSCAIAKAEFDHLNSLLMDEVPKLYEGRIAYFQPSLQALVNAQTTYYNEAEVIYSQLCKQLKEGYRTDKKEDEDADGGFSLDPDELKLTIQQKLSEIRSLSIAVDDQIK
ncbi:hypothetical protein HELRODRAFT_168178 [Helobdella robusta]|uniref:BAR domain-containing protein n=1 Tax=Helobdella robusta TaxID=6412 RepID=T1F096_HELRO|nr:hypothetical protein HELRODRAFT_168178 [Helobdella robusta]ESO09217.1 hypothetical protein HELRODRAFT_168178 [Helobdella robusta]